MVDAEDALSSVSSVALFIRGPLHPWFFLGC